MSIKPGGYSAEVLIPLTALELPADPKGKYIGFDVKLDDVNGLDEQTRQAISEFWNSSGDAHKNRLSFGFIAF